MDKYTAGKANLLIDNGSVFDLVAMFVLLLGGDKDYANRIYGLFSEYLDKGYTYLDIKTEIFKAFYDRNKNFRWNMFTGKKGGDVTKINLLKTNTRYYHKQLKLLNDLPTVERDIDNGTLVSRTPEYFLEPVASYTIQEFIRYFYQVMPMDLQAQPPSKMVGLIKYKIDTFGIDKMLFMTDIYAQWCKENSTIFSLSRWDEYSHLADERLTEIKGAFAEDKPYYVPKQRRLFNV